MKGLLLAVGAIQLFRGRFKVNRSVPLTIDFPRENSYKENADEEISSILFE